ncbi:MAG: hypothetical protein SH868_05035 [Bythopirellula sp.]|nr:hypothetical protein [Bythopirellula sp.]
MSKFNKNNRFHMERLEDRQMMAGDVFATMSTDGTLVLLEAGNSVGGAQSVMVQPLTNGKVRVTGITSPANIVGSNILNANGQNLGIPEFSGVKNIQINFGDGPDQVIVGSSVKNLIPFGSVSINTEGSAFSTRDNDQVFVQNLKVGQKLDIRTGAGQDGVRVVKSEVVRQGATPPNFTIKSGVISAAGEADKDAVTVDGVKVQGVVSIDTGASSDSLTVKNADFGFVIGTTSVDNATIRSGSGADVINIGSDANNFGFTTVRGHLTLDAGSDSQNDADIVRIQDLEVFQGLSLTLGGGNDRLDMANVDIGKDMFFSAMSGNDTVVMANVAVFDNFFAEMGEGDDTLNMIGVKARRVEANGAGGAIDRLFTYDMSNVPIIKTGFEQINGRSISTKRVTSGLNLIPTIEPQLVR